MSSAKYLTLDSSVVAQVGELQRLSAEQSDLIVSLGIDVLILNEEDIRLRSTNIGSTFGLPPKGIYQAAQQVSKIFWEVSKLPPRAIAVAEDLLKQTGLPPDVVSVLVKVYKANKTRLLQVKSNLCIGTKAYNDLSWRIDVEIAKRSMDVSMSPKFMLRLDLTSVSAGAGLESTYAPSSSSSSSASVIAHGITVARNDDSTSASVKGLLGPDNVTSYHLQADYDSMKRIQDELQRALETAASAHCQRFSRYIT